jgi:hypothetical protein
MPTKMSNGEFITYFIDLPKYMSIPPSIVLLKTNGGLEMSELLEQTK